MPWWIKSYEIMNKINLSSLKLSLSVFGHDDEKSNQLLIISTYVNKLSLWYLLPWKYFKMMLVYHFSLWAKESCHKPHTSKGYTYRKQPTMNLFKNPNVLLTLGSNIHCWLKDTNP
jgi:hypothetical protein